MNIVNIPCRQRTTPPGFTLVELLVVIALVALVAALLFPVFARSREAARRGACASNLRQIGLAVAQYVQDYGETHPPDKPAPEAAGWAALIQPYLKDVRVLQCPSEETPPNPDSAGVGYTDYLYNRCALGKGLAAFAAPAGTILCLDGIRGDSGMWDNGTSGEYHDCRGNSEVPNATPGVATWLHRPGEAPVFRYAERHLAGAIYLFADGHVRSLTPLAVYNNCTPPRSQPSFAYN
jgi:prepilin-type N-terminal cleavage/methylation domain-containing protein/prepilin-type processing-associated H-X9-DG protein